VEAPVAAEAEGDEVVPSVPPALGAELEVVELEAGDGAAGLALAAVPVEDGPAGGVGDVPFAPFVLGEVPWPISSVSWFRRKSSSHVSGRPSPFRLVTVH
jgi:hypothetical protein